MWELIRTSSDGTRTWFRNLNAPGFVQIVPIAHLPPLMLPQNPSQDGVTLSTVAPTLHSRIYHDESSQVWARTRVCEVGTDTCFYQTAPDGSAWTKIGTDFMAGDFSWSVPASTLYWNHEYTWSVNVKDASATYGWSQPIRFTAVVPQQPSLRRGTTDAYRDEQGVNLYSGWYGRTETDLSLPGVNGPIAMPRTYDGQDNVTDRAFGVGWFSALDAQWVQNTGGSLITITLPDGQVRGYGRNPNGSYGGPLGEKVNSTVSIHSRTIVLAEVAYTFDLTSGRLKTIRRGPDDLTRFGTDSEGRIDWVDDVYSGRRIYLSWSNGHVVAESTGPEETGLVWRYRYAAGVMNQVCDARSRCASYAYDASKRMTGFTPSGSGNWTTVAYNNGRVSKVTLPDGEWTYNHVTTPENMRSVGVSITIQVVDPRSSTWFGFDETGALRYRWRNRFTPTLTDVYSYFYDVAGRLTSEVDQNNRVVGEYRYDAVVGAVDTSIKYVDVDDEGHVDATGTGYVYERPSGAWSDPRAGVLRRVLHPNGSATEFDYLSDGQVSSKTEPIGANATATTTYQYTCLNDGRGISGPPAVNDTDGGADATQPCGLLSRLIEPTGATTKYSYNSHGDLTRIEEPTGKRTDRTYDAYGRAVTEKISTNQNPDGATTTFTHDAAGNVLTETGPAVVNPVTGELHQRRLTIERDDFALPTRIETVDLFHPDAPGNRRVSLIEYDARGRQTKVTEDGAVTSRTAYNAFGQPTEVYESNGARKEYVYTKAGQLATVKLTNFVDKPWQAMPPPARRVTLESYGYDPAGRVMYSIRPKGEYLVYKYTYDGLVISESQGKPGPDGVIKEVYHHDYRYDLSRNPVSDRRGGTTTGFVTLVSEYDRGNRLTAMTVDPNSVSGTAALARRIAYRFDAAGRRLATTLSDGTRSEEVRYTYDGAGSLIGEEVENGSNDLLTQYKPSPYGVDVSVTTPRGRTEVLGQVMPDPRFTTTTALDALGRPSAVTSPEIDLDPGDGSAPVATTTKVTTGYNAFGEVSDVKDARGAVTHTTYDNRGRRVRVDHPAIDGESSGVASERWTYDVAGNVITHTDRRGGVTTNDYDLQNRLVRTRHPAVAGESHGPPEIFTFDDHGNLLERSDRSGAFTSWVYDEYDRPIRMETVNRFPGEGTSKQTHYTYDDLGNLLTEHEQATGVRSTYTYNKVGERLSATTTGRGTTAWAYDLAGRPVSETTPAPHSAMTASSYDLAGRLTRTVERSIGGNAAREHSFLYDADSNLVKYTDPRGGEWSAAYDALGRRTSSTDPSPTSPTGQTMPAPQLTFGYDANGNQTRSTDARGNDTFTRYSSRNQPLTVVEPETGTHPDAADRTWRYQYSAADDVVGVAQPGGATLTRTYDKRGQLTTETGVLHGSEVSRSFAYDGAGRLIKASRPGGNYEVWYDDYDQVMAYDEFGAATGWTYDYDIAGRITRATRPGNGGTVNYAYQNGRLSRQWDTLSGTTRTYQYDNAGRVGGIKLSNTSTNAAGASLQYTYDDLGRRTAEKVVGPNDATLGTFSYTWDLNDNLTGQSASGQFASPHSDHRYTYDQADRLISAEDTVAGTGEDYQWDAAGNRESVTPWTGTLDNKTRGSPTTFSYDERNRLTSIRGDGADIDYVYTARGDLTGTTVASAGGQPETSATTFDAFGRLTADSSSSTSGYKYDSLDRLVGTDSEPNAFRYDGLGREPVDGPGGWSGVRLVDGTLVAARSGAGTPVSDLAANPHGDVSSAIDPTTGATRGRQTYGAFGETLDSTGDIGPVGWQGSWTDPDSGRSRADARWFDPRAGRFISQDRAPLAPTAAAEANLYGYGNANPVSNRDVNGNWAFPIQFDPIGALGDGLRTLGTSLKSGLASAAGGALGIARTLAPTVGRAALGALAAALTPEVLTLVAAAIVVVVAVAGVVYLVNEITGQRTPVTSTVPAPVIPKPAPVPAQVVNPTAIASTRAMPTTYTPGSTTRWSDDNNIYTSVATTVTTTVKVTLNNGDSYYDRSQTIKNVTTSVPIFDYSTAVRDAGTQVLPIPRLPVPVATQSSGRCGSGGSIATCVNEHQPAMPRAPTAKDPASKPGGDAGGGKPPRTPSSGGDTCQPEEGDGGDTPGPADSNYRGRYNADLASRGVPRLPRDWDAHHRIPQMYRGDPRFAGFDFDGPSNIRGVPGNRSGTGTANIHNQITQDWARFVADNPCASRSEIEDFASTIDERYEGYWWR